MTHRGKQQHLLLDSEKRFGEEKRRLEDKIGPDALDGMENVIDLHLKVAMDEYDFASAHFEKMGRNMTLMLLTLVVMLFTCFHLPKTRSLITIALNLLPFVVNMVAIFFLAIELMRGDTFRLPAEELSSLSKKTGRTSEDAARLLTGLTFIIRETRTACHRREKIWRIALILLLSGAFTLLGKEVCLACFM